MRHKFTMQKTHLTTLLPVVFLLGCSTPSLDNLSLKSKAPPPVYLPENTYSVDFLPNDFAKVAVLPVHHSLESGATSIEYLGSIMLNELNGKAKLEAVSLTRTSLQRLVGESSVSSTSTLPSGLSRSNPLIDWRRRSPFHRSYPLLPIQTNKHWSQM